MLPTHDLAHLQERYPGHSVELSGNMICVTVAAFTLGQGFTEPAADLLLRLAPGYPDVPPDMWWFAPAVRRTDGRQIAATEAVEVYFNKPWQRWSRHLPAGVWRSGIDGLESYFSVIRRELTSAGARAAA